MVDELLLLHYLDDISEEGDDDGDEVQTDAWDGYTLEELGIVEGDDEDDWFEEEFDDDPGELGVEPDSY